MKYWDALFPLLVLFVVPLVVKGLWDEWSGALSRHRRGEPLRASEAESLRRQAAAAAAHEQRVRRLAEVRQQHDRDPHCILDRSFRREFEDFGLGAEVYADVIQASGYRCAACNRQFSERRRKPLLAVDHIKPRSLYPHLLYVRSNLQVLCRSCNSHKSAYDGADWKDVVATRRRTAAAKKRIAARKPTQ